MWDINLENFYNRLLVWIKFKFVLMIVKSCKLRGEKQKMGVVWDLSLEMFDNRLLVWIKFKFFLNYC